MSPARLQELGYAIAEALAREGAQVVVNGRTSARVDQALEKLKQAKVRGKVEGLAADLGTADGCKLAIERFPELEILVNNLGTFEIKPFEEISDQDWLRFFEVNVLSGVRLSRHYFPAMKKRHWGRILFISSESAVHIPAEMIHYGMTKTAQVAIARGMAETTLGTQVTVNTLLPGPTASEGAMNFIDKFAASTNKTRKEFEQEFFKTIRPTSLLQRFETSEEIGTVAAFLCSPLASAINGAAVRADGGVIRAIL